MIRGIADFQKDQAEYLRMRLALWPHASEEEHFKDMIHIYKGEPFYKHELTWKVFVIERTNGKLGGFIELSLYPELPFVKSSPVGYIEGWYVDEDLRSQGLGSRLVYLGEEWAKQKKCVHMASDVESGNALSQQAHRALGYVQAFDTSSGTYYKKRI